MVSRKELCIKWEFFNKLIESTCLFHLKWKEWNCKNATLFRNIQNLKDGNMSCSVRLTGSTQKQERLKDLLSQAGVSKEGNGWGTGGELLEVPDSCQKKKKKKELSKLWMTSELILGYGEFLLPGHQFIFQTGLAVARTHYCSTAYMQLSVKPALISALVGHHCRWVQNWRQWLILPPQGSALRCSIRRSKKGALLSLMVCPECESAVWSLPSPSQTLSKVNFMRTKELVLHQLQKPV